MQSINDISTKAFLYLLSMLDKGYLKLDNAPGTFMPLIVERIFTHSGFEEVYSVSHYGKQNGDLMADPDMTFGLKEGKFYPLSFRNDYVGVDQEVISNKDEPEPRVDLKRQQELAVFADIWFENIIDQQRLKL